MLLPDKQTSDQELQVNFVWEIWRSWKAWLCTWNINKTVWYICL